MIDSARIKQLAASCGFSLCGVIPALSITEHRPYIERWISSGKGSVPAHYISRTLDLRIDVRTAVKGAKSVITCGVNYKNEAWNQPNDPALAQIASYALTRDYHFTIKQMLENMLESLKNDYPGLSGRCFTDSAPLLEKELAIRAGLGWRGRNSLLVTKDYGSYVLLGEIVLDMEVATYDSPLGKNGCGTCRKCIDSCPNGAICDDGSIDARLCISRATMYPSVGDLPTYGWVFGCDSCQQCCPYNQQSPMHSNNRFDTQVDYRTITRSFWEGLTDEKFTEIFGQTPIAFFRR